MFILFIKCGFEVMVCLVFFLVKLIMNGSVVLFRVFVEVWVIVLGIFVM